MSKVLTNPLLSGMHFIDVCQETILCNGWSLEKDSNQLIDTDVHFTAYNQQKNINTAFSIYFLQANNYSDENLTILFEKKVKSIDRNLFPYLAIITSINLSTKLKNYFQDEYYVQIIDLHFLGLLASVQTELLNSLRDICDIDIHSLPLNTSIKNSIACDKKKPVEVNTSHLRVPSLKTASYQKNFKHSKRSDELIKSLSSIKPGNKSGSAYRYEDTCTEILQHLFSDHLTGWYKQKYTSDQLHRYDLICRVLDDHELWRFIANELSSRYVLFEFKNYSKPIGQNEVYSTGKYLYQHAKRNVCFLVSRFQASKGAILASQGIMRDQNRLIIHLHDRDLIDLLSAKKYCKDHNQQLFKIIDKTLMSLPK